MANQVAARLKGDDYQHLFAWLQALELLIPRKSVRLLRVEDESAGSVDDVTVLHERGTTTPDRYHQVKYHVDHRGQYSTDVLIAHDEGATSLLKKFEASWRKLRAGASGRAVELHLVSNWVWHSEDKIGTCIDGDTGALTKAFFSKGPQSDVGKLRDRWMDHLTLDRPEFDAFARSLRFRLGYFGGGELEARTAERMELLRLRFNEDALVTAAGVVRGWVKMGVADVSAEVLQNEIDRHKLRAEEESERCVTVYMTTIKTQRFDVTPDYSLDWRGLFQGPDAQKGHAALDPNSWNDRMLPELQALEARINMETDCRLIRARGLSRLSAWFAFGYTFSSVNRYEIEVDQQGKRWRTDAATNLDYRLRAGGRQDMPRGEELDGAGTTVAVGISLTGSLESAVRSHLNEMRAGGEPVAALLLIEPDAGTGPECLGSAGDVAAFAREAKLMMREFVNAWGATDLLLYYFGPLSGACFLGHQLNAVCRKIQIMEDQKPGYAASFILE